MGSCESLVASLACNRASTDSRSRSCNRVSVRGGQAILVRAKRYLRLALVQARQGAGCLPATS
jgi:hypothetical protein